MKKKQLIINLAALLLALVIAFAAGADFRKMHEPDKIFTGNPAITEVRKLSHYNPNLKGTASDTDIYILDSGVPGGKALIYGGTHANESAAVLNAITYIENAKVEQGTLYVIFQANQSAITNTIPLRAQMTHINFTLSDGSQRSLRTGSRLSNPVHQWPDPNYRLNSSTRILKHEEVAEIRNLNRNHPGMADGYLTEMACYGLRQLIEQEGIDLIFDGHEASPEFLRVNYLIAHDRAMELGSTAILNASLEAMMQGNMEGYPFKIDLSGASSWGLSHRALGDNTKTMATLFETLNPVMGFCHGKVTEELVKNGKSDNYVKITQLGLLNSGELDDTGSPMALRTAYQMEMSRNLLGALTEMYPEKAVVVSGLPTFEQMVEGGLEATLKPLK